MAFTVLVRLADYARLSSRFTIATGKITGGFQRFKNLRGTMPSLHFTGGHQVKAGQTLMEAERMEVWWKVTTDGIHPGTWQHFVEVGLRGTKDAFIRYPATYQETSQGVRILLQAPYNESTVTGLALLKDVASAFTGHGYRIVEKFSVAGTVGVAAYVLESAWKWDQPVDLNA